MYYAEKIINGILCSKSSPNAEWIPLTQEQLTKKINRLETGWNRTLDQLQKAHEEIESLTKRIEFLNRELNYEITESQRENQPPRN